MFRLVLLPLLLALTGSLASAGKLIGIGPTEIVPYENECDLALTHNDQLPSKRMFGDGFQLVQGVPPINELVAESLYQSLLPKSSADENEFRDVRFDILKLLTEDISSGVEVTQVESKKRDGSPRSRVNLNAQQAMVLKLHLQKFLKRLEAIYYHEMEFEHLELRILSEEESQKHDSHVYYHYDAGDLRFTETMIGVTTFVRANGKSYFAPRNVPLLFTADDGESVFLDHPMTEHGHPRTKGRRLLLVGTVHLN